MVNALGALMVLYGRGGIAIRAHASRAEDLWFEPDSMPYLNARLLFT